MDFDDQAENLDADQENIYNDIILDENLSNEYKSIKDAVIFLIECNQSMLDNSFHHIFEIAESFLKTKIITNENDLFSLIIYNTAIKNNILNFDGINVIFPMSAPDAKLIKDLKIISQNSQEKYNPKFKEFLNDNFPIYENKTNNSNINISDSEVTLNEGLWICHSELKNIDPKNYKRRIFLFTDDDNPMSSNGNLTKRELTIQRAKDMLESEIVLELFPMNFVKNFDLRKFYCEIIPKEDNSNEDLILTKDSSKNKLRELTKRIRQKEIKKRTIGSCLFYLSKDVKVSVNFYATVKKTVKNKSYMIDARSNKTLSNVNQILCKETGSTLFPHQIGTFHEYGGKKIQFTKEDMKQIKTFDTPGIKLMGFKSLESIKSFYNIRESYFIYPNENMTSGASQLFDALIKQMTNKNKVAIVKFVPREGTNIRFCALLPQKEVFDEDYFQTPPGFNLIFLPYADEIRCNSDIFNNINTDKKNKDENDKVEIKEEESLAAKKLIKKMNIDFDSRNFENPMIQKFYSTLQALALGESNIEPIEDHIQPDQEGLKKLNDVDLEFANVFYGGKRFYNFNEQKKIKNKRNNIDDNEEGKTNIKVKKTNDKFKRSYNDNDNISINSGVSENNFKDKNMKSKKSDFSNDDLLIRVEDGTFSSFTVQELKEICQLKNLRISTKMKKLEYIDLIKEYLYGTLDNNK